MPDSGVIQSAREFQATPSGLQRKWNLEIHAAMDARKKWLQEADRANKRYLGEVSGNEPGSRTRINLFHSNTNIIRSILYSQVPKADVSRRYADPDDEEARVSSEALERHLNTDIEDNADDFQSEVKDCILDWKVIGLGQARLRYDMEEETATEAEGKAVAAYQRKTKENIDTEYVHWRDFLWSPARRWREVRWVAFRAEMTRDAAIKRFGKQIGQALPMQQRKAKDDGETPDDLKDAWSRIAIWEVWSKDDKTVYWYCDGYSRILDQKKDPIGLKCFFPCPRPLLANVTTSKLMPKPDLELDKHLYDEIDDIANRLRKLVKAARVTGAFDKAFPELARIFEEAEEGQLVGVAKWAALSERGGLNGAFQLVDLTPIVGAIQVLTEKLAEKISLLDQVIGLSDIVRGEQTRQETATTSRLKAGFASTRLQSDQDEVARFSTDIQKMKAEIISLHFDAKTIVERSNLMRVETMEQQVPDPRTGQLTVQRVPNMDLIARAVKLIKSDFWQYRIEVKADSIALRDYAALKQERVEVMSAIGGLFQQAIPMVEMFPQSAPFVLQLGKWLIASCKGSQQIEGEFERFAAQVEKATANPQPKPPDPKLQAAQVKAQAEQGKAQAQMQQTQVDGQVHMQRAAMDMHVAQQQHQLDVTKMVNQVEAEAQRAAIALAKPQGAQT